MPLAWRPERASARLHSEPGLTAKVAYAARARAEGKGLSAPGASETDQWNWAVSVEPASAVVEDSGLTAWAMASK
ncbi:hypothetical protein GCM10027418_14950 [Mariniluteicoccus endophyticus]